MSGKQLESIQCVEDLEFSQKCKDASGKANRMLGFIKKKHAFKNKDILVILPICNRLIRPHLEYAVQFWSPHLAKDSKIRSCPVQGYEDYPFFA